MTEQIPEHTNSVALPAESCEVEARLELASALGPSEKAAVLYYLLHDAQGREIDPLPGTLYSQKFGPFVYLPARQGENALVQRIAVPKETANFLAGFVGWEAKLEDQEATLELIPRQEPVETDFDSASARSGVSIDEVFLSYPVRGEAEIELSWSYRITPGAQGLLLIVFLDARGERLLPPNSLAVNPEHGTYAYLAAGPDESSRSSLSMRTPARTAEIRITGSRWRGDGAFILERPDLVFDGSEELSRSEQAAKWVADLDAGDDILVVHTTASAIRKDNTLLLRSNRLALSLAERGWKVLFVPFSGLADPDVDWVISSALMQVPATSLADVIAQILARCTHGRRMYLCSSRTDVSAIALQNRLQDHGWKIIYEIRDDMEEFQRVGYSRWYRAALEERFSREADGVIATSPRLAERISIIAERDDVGLIPNAAPDELIVATAKMRNTEYFETTRKHPIVGYLGHLTNSWFDWRAVLDVMRRLPNISFEIIGHGMPDTVHLPMNARFLGPMSHSDAISFMGRWRVGIIPFIESRLTYGVDPNKLYEYVALGIPTVSAPMGQVAAAPGAQIYHSVDEFAGLVSDAVAFEPTTDFYAECEKYLGDSAWSVRAQQVDDYLKGAWR